MTDDYEAREVGIRSEMRHDDLMDSLKSLLAQLDDALANHDLDMRGYVERARENLAQIVRSA